MAPRLGFEPRTFWLAVDARNRRRWSPTAVQRSVPLGLGLYALVVVWFARYVKDPDECKQSMPWNEKSAVTYLTTHEGHLRLVRTAIERSANCRMLGAVTFSPRNTI